MNQLATFQAKLYRFGASEKARLLKVYYHRWLFVGLLGATACTTQPLPPDALRAWVAEPKNGLVQTQEIGAIKAQCSYRLPELLAAQEVRNTHQPLTRLTLDSAQQAYRSRTHFALDLSQNGTEYETEFAGNPAQYAAVVQYLSAGIATDSYLHIPGQDSVPAMAAMYMRQYGNTGRSTVLLIFDTPPAALTTGCRLNVAGRKELLPPFRFNFLATAFQAIPPLAVTN